MSQDLDAVAALRLQLIGAIADQTGMREQFCEPFADAVLVFLQREYGGAQLYVPAAPRQYDVLQIAAALKRGESISRVCMEHSISRTTLYRLFPGGLPRADEFDPESQSSVKVGTTG